MTTPTREEIERLITDLTPPPPPIRHDWPNGIVAAARKGAAELRRLHSQPGGALAEATATEGFDHSSADKMFWLSEYQKLTTNLLHWIEHGLSEQSAKALRQMQDRWVLACNQNERDKHKAASMPPPVAPAQSAEATATEQPGGVRVASEHEELAPGITAGQLADFAEALTGYEDDELVLPGGGATPAAGRPVPVSVIGQGSTDADTHVAPSATGTGSGQPSIAAQAKAVHVAMGGTLQTAHHYKALSAAAETLRVVTGMVAALESCVGHIEETNKWHPEDHPINDCPVLNSARAALRRLAEEGDGT